MSIRKLNIEDNKNDYYIKEYSSDSDDINIDIYHQILSKKSIFYVTNFNHSDHIEIKPSSLKNIFLKGQLEAKEQILFSFYQGLIPSKNNKDDINNKKDSYKNKLRGAKKKPKIENNIDNENEDITLDVSSPDNFIRNYDSQDSNIMCLNIDNEKNENNLDPERDLLNGKSNDMFKKKEKLKTNNLISFYNNKIKVTNDNLKCFYLSLVLCGLIYIIYFFDALIDEKKNITCLYNTFCFPMAIILIVTGIYGYYKVDEKIYDDKICIYLTYSSLISTILSFIFSRLSSEETVRNNIIMSVLFNLITACLSGICLYIITSLQGKDQKEQKFEKINIV